MRKCFLLVLFLSSLMVSLSQSLNTSYIRDWATYFGGQGSSAVAIDVDKRNNNLIAGFDVSVPFFLSNDSSYYNNYFTIFNDLSHFYSNYALISSFKSNGTLAQSAGLPLSLRKLQVSSSGKIVLFGSTDYIWQHTQNVWTPHLLEDQLGIIVSVNPDFSLDWHLNFSMFGPTSYVLDFALDEDGFIYTAINTDSLQMGTVNSFQPLSQGHSTFICKISPSGQLVWGTFYGYSYIQSLDIKN